MPKTRPKTRPKPHAKVSFAPAYDTSWVRTGVAILLVLLGIAWIAVYVAVEQDAANFIAFAGAKKPSDPLPWMADLKRWNFVIGFGLIFVGMALSAAKSTPMGRGRGVVIGMLGSFLIGLAWIVVYYIVGQDGSIPVMDSLAQSNLLVGIGFMAVGFTFATHWE